MARKKHEYKKKPNGKNATGRPKVKIDKGLFESMCGYQCTKEEICGMLKIDEKTLTRWCKDTYDKSFQEAFEAHSSKGKVSLRRAQYKSAMGGSIQMQKWLGTQWLDQSDRVENEISGKDGGPIEIKNPLEEINSRISSLIDGEAKKEDIK